MQISRRALLVTTALGVVLAASPSWARSISGVLPWEPDAGAPPEPFQPGGWQYFTPDEGAAVEAIADRLIPPDPKTPGGKDAGCAVFIDRQLAGPYGTSRGLYMRPPFQEGTKQQGPQSPLTPAARYRQSLAALDKYCHDTYAGKPFAELPDAEKDKILTALEKGPLKLGTLSGTAFFEQVLKDTQQGFFADPVYGGNRDMVAWKMIGFPGARYDYRDWVERHNERYPLPPIGLRSLPTGAPK